MQHLVLPPTSKKTVPARKKPRISGALHISWTLNVVWICPWLSSCRSAVKERLCAAWWSYRSPPRAFVRQDYYPLVRSRSFYCCGAACLSAQAELLQIQVQIRLRQQGAFLRIVGRRAVQWKCFQLWDHCFVNASLWFLPIIFVVQTPIINVSAIIGII